MHRFQKLALCVVVLACIAPAARARPWKSTASNAGLPTMGSTAVVVPAIPSDRRTVATHGDGWVSYPADGFFATISISSGMSLPSEAAKKMDRVLDRVQVILLTESLPAAVAQPEAFSIKPAYTLGQVIASRRYMVTVDSLEMAKRVAEVLAAETDGSNTVNDQAKVISIYPSARSSKFDADPEAARAESRRLALIDARNKATQNAAALDMRLGPPVTVGQIAVSNFGTDAYSQTGVHASVDVLFELLDP